MYRLVFPAILAIALVARAAPAERGQLDASPTLFTVMAAINAAGYDADLQSPNGSELRKIVRAELARRNIPSLAGLKEFFQRRRQRNDNAELSQYISFGLTAGPPPEFAINLRDVDTPPDVSSLRDLSPLLAAFYREADIADLWQRSQPYIDAEIARYHAPVAEAVLQVNAYLRQQTSGFRGRHFQIYGNEFTVVVSPGPQPRIADVRHAYLQYLLDPMATRNQETLNRKKPLLEHAQRARWLPDSFKDDILLMTTESLVRAVESRLDHKPAVVQQALREGYILTPFFAEQLPLYEKQEQSMLIYYPGMVQAIEMYKEDQRLSQVEFNREQTVRTVPVAPPPPPPPLTGAARTLDDAEQLYTDRDKDPGNLDKARDLYLKVLDETDQRRMQAAAYFGLARIRSLRKDPDEAERLFEKVLQSEPDPQVQAWTLVYLGRLSLAADDREQARKYFEEALKVAGASDKARAEASKGVQESSKQ